jgi:hypothetical protein
VVVAVLVATRVQAEFLKSYGVYLMTLFCVTDGDDGSQPHGRLRRQMSLGHAASSASAPSRCDPC